MQRIRLIHWKAAEAEERAGWLRAADYEVVYETLNPTSLRELSENPPTAVVIDLGRLPMQGRDVGLLLRQRKGTRNVPLVFVGGKPDKVARVKESLSKAVYADWDGIGGTLKAALRIHR